MSYKGRFRPKEPSKYLGNPQNIIYRSWLEYRFMSYLDRHSNVMNWASEELAIPYISPVDNRRHRYFVDFFIRYKNNKQEIEEKLVEIKSSQQCKAPILKEGAHWKQRKRYARDLATWSINKAKWQAAEQYANKQGWSFIVLTEKDLSAYK